MAASSLDKFMTVVRNISGGTKNFPFLPPFGVTLDDDEDFKYPGDLAAALKGKRRDWDAFESAVDNGLLVIIQTPTVARFDTSANRTRYIEVTGGAVVVTDPPDGSYTGTAPTF